jgi:sugar phosphate isomerase/epimerase
MTRLCGIGDEAADAFATQVRLHQRLGLAGIEIRGIDGWSLDTVDDERFAAAARLVRRAGLSVPVLDTPLGGWADSVHSDLSESVARLGRYARWARSVGCSQLRVMSYPDPGLGAGEWRRYAVRRLATLARHARRYGMTLLHENCVGWAGQDPDRAVELVEAIGSTEFQLLFDTGNGLAYGYDALGYLERILPYVRHVHLKDGVPGPRYLPPGEGAVGVASCLSALDRAGYRGWYSIEPHIAYQPHRSWAAPQHIRVEAYTECARRAAALLVSPNAVAGAR